MIGHNAEIGVSQAAGDETTKFRYLSLHIGDWLVGTSKMTYECQGFYIEFLARLYDHGKPFLDDDREMSDLFNISIRVWKRLKEALVAMGKMIVRNGCLTNSRFEKERQKRADEIRKRSQSALSRWENSRKNPEKIQDNLVEISGKVSGNSSIGINEINDLKVKQDSPPLTITITDSLKDKKERSPNGDSSLSVEATLNFDERGIPLVVNGKRQALEKILAGRAEVDAALEAVARKIDATSTMEELIVEVATYAASVKPTRKSVPEEYTKDFEEFWKLYPRMEGKAAASKAWHKLSLTQKRKAYRALKEQLPNLNAKRSDRRGNFCPMPATWINQGRFDDSPEAAPSAKAADPHEDLYASLQPWT